MTPFRTVGYGRQGYVLLPQPTMNLTGALKFVELIEHQLDGLLHAPIWFLLDSVFVCNFAVAHSTPRQGKVRARFGSAAPVARSRGSARVARYSFPPRSLPSGQRRVS